MAKKLKIAFDMDDVIADSSESWRVEINKRTGGSLQPEHFQVPGDYDNYYVSLWAKHGISDKFSMDDLDNQMKTDQSHIKAHNQSLEVLTKLAKKFELIIVTARDSDKEKASKKWLDIQFPGLFKAVIITEYDGERPLKNKGEICKEIGADWLVDDNPGHCLDAVDNGVEAILFGEYGWHHKAPDHLVRCKDWPAVLEYFNAQTK